MNYHSYSKSGGYVNVTTKLLALTAGAILLAACGAAAPGAPAGSAAAKTGAAAPVAPLTPVGIQISATGLAFFPLFVAKDLGVFEKHGLDVKLLTMPPPTAIPAIQKGDLQFMSTIGSAGRAIERGLSLKVVDVMLSRPAIVLMGGPGINKLDDLRGKIISASTPDDTLTQLTIAMLTKRGLPANSYQVLHTGTDNAAKLAAVQNGAAQAAVLDLVNWLQIEDKLKPSGYSELLNSMQEIEMPYSGLATSTDFIQSKPDVVRRTAAAVVEATQLSSTDKERVTGVMVKEMGLTQDVADKLFDQCKQLSLWQTDGRATSPGMSFVAGLDQAALKLDKPPTEAQIFDWSFLPNEGSSK
jgi:NitT/TauT family transport system substrate-binding protein